MTYSVAIVSRQSGLSETSRFFNTKRAALNWARFLRTLAMSPKPPSTKVTPAGF